jgi:hypothetical protein
MSVRRRLVAPLYTDSSRALALSGLLLAKNFGLPEATFDGFPREEAYFVRGSVPAVEATPVQGALNSPPTTHKYRLLAQEASPRPFSRGSRKGGPSSLHRTGKDNARSSSEPVRRPVAALHSVRDSLLSRASVS